MSKSLWVFLASGALAAGGFSGCHRAAGTAAASGAAGSHAAPPVSVIGGKVARRDTPIYLDGIGTVVASNTVTVHAQVSGQLESVAFREGHDVSAGDLLALIDPRPMQAAFDQAKAKTAEDQAQLDNARTTYQRNASLLQKGMIDQQTVDTEKAAVDQFSAAVQADNAAVEQAGVSLGYTRITAPISGRTGLRQVDAGNVVNPGDANGLVVITQLKPISAVFTLPQQDWPQIQRLLSAGGQLTVLAYDRDSLKPLDRGTLSVVDNEIDPTTGTIKLKAEFPNPKLILWPGQFINVRLLVETRKDAIVVPASVIQRGPDGAFAFVVKPDSTVEVRPVQVAQIDGGMALIDDGLKAGEEVVVDGQYKLQAGGKVNVTEAAGAPGAAAGGKAPHKRKKPSQ